MNNIENIQEYIPTVYVNDSEPDLDETNLNKTEQAIKRVTDAANKAIDALKQLDREKLALSAISNVLSDATDKVPSLALANTMQLAINDLNSNLGAELVTGDMLSYALRMSRGFYVIRTDNTTANTPKDYMSGYIVKRFDNPNQITIVLFELGKTKPYYNSYNGSAWSGWVAGLQDSDLVINSPIKKTKVALENDRLLFWVYTDGDAMMNGYRVDFNGAEKRIYYGKITNGIYSNIGGTTLT